MIEFDSRITEVIQRTDDVKSFRFETKENATFVAGQFFFLTIKVDGKDASKHFSFSNSPTEKGYIEFTKRITTSSFSQALDKLKVGGEIHVKMPFGKFTLEDNNKKIAFLSGGIGITPIRSMCKFAIDKGLKKDMVLLYGNSLEKDIIFKDDLDKLQSESKNFKVVHTLTSKNEEALTGWEGRKQYIDDNMVKEEITDYKERLFYICGPPLMVSGLVKILLEKLNLSQEQVKFENFTGY